MRLRTLGLVGGSGGFGGTTGFGFATGLGGSAGLAAIFIGADGLAAVCFAVDLVAAIPAFFLAATSLRVAFRAGRVAVGFELLAAFEFTGLVTVFVFAAFAVATAFPEAPLVRLALTATFLMTLVLAAWLAVGFAGFPFSGFVVELLVCGFPLAADFVFLAIGFDEDALDFVDFAGFFATTDLAVFDLLFAPCF